MLKDSRLLALDAFRIADELSHSGLRAACARLSARASPEDVLDEASEPTRCALEQAARQLPKEPAQDAFTALSRKLKLRRIDEQLRHIAKVTGQIQSGEELSDDVRLLMAERVTLLALRKRVTEEAVTGTPGTKRSQQPV